MSDNSFNLFPPEHTQNNSSTFAYSNNNNAFNISTFGRRSQTANLNNSPLGFLTLLSPPQSQFSLETRPQPLLFGTNQSLVLQQPRPFSQLTILNPQESHHQNGLTIPQPYNQTQFNPSGHLDFVVLNLNDIIKNLSKIFNYYDVLTGHLNNEIQNINALNGNELIIQLNNQAQFNSSFPYNYNNNNNRNNEPGGNIDNMVLNLNVVINKSKSLSEILNDHHVLAGCLDDEVRNIPRLPYNYYNSNNNHNIELFGRLIGTVQNLNKINKNLSEILNGHRILSGHLDNGIQNISRLSYNYYNNNDHNNGHIDDAVLSLNVINKSLSNILNDCGILDGQLNDEIQNINALNRNLSNIFNNQ
nr:13417_t:CDS:2 [Entrophospora candida]